MKSISEEVSLLERHKENKTKEWYVYLYLYLGLLQ